MITIETIVTSRKQYVIDHVMPSDLDPDIKEGLKKKEELIKSIDGDYIRKIYPDIDETIVQINETGISEEKYLKFLNGESASIFRESADVATVKIQYCIDNGSLQSYETNSIIEIDGLKRTINVSDDTDTEETVPLESIGIQAIDAPINLIPPSSLLKAEDSDIVTLTYHANGGKLVDSGQEKATVEVDKNTGTYYYPAATKDGCIFKNWVVIKNETKVPISSGQSIIYKYDHTVYAVWGAEITYDANGGTFEDGETQRKQVIEDVDEETYIVPDETILYPLIDDPISGTKMAKFQFKDWAVKVGENEVTVVTDNRLVIKANHTVYARKNEFCTKCGAYKPCACDEEIVIEECPECLKNPCICNDENHRRLYFLLTLTGSNIDTYWSRNVYWSILPQGVEKPETCYFVKLNHVSDVLDTSDLLTKSDVKIINFINFNTTYNSIDELLLYLSEFDYNVTREQLAKWVSYDYILLKREEVATYDKMELKSGCFCKVSTENKNYVYYNGIWIRLPEGLSNLGVFDNGKMLGTPYIGMGGAQVPEMYDEESEEMTDGGGLYCLTIMLACNKYEENDINSFIYIKVNPKQPQAQNKKNCDKPPACVKDEEQDPEDQEGEAELCEDNGVEKTSINGQPAVNTNSLQTVLTDAFQKNLEPIWKAVGKLKLGLGASLKALFTANIGITIEGFFDALANITAIIELLAEIEAALVAKLTASVAIKIKIDIGFKLLAKITGKIKASLELIKKQIECFMDSLLPELHIAFETEINLSIDNILNQGQIVQSALDAELDTGIIGKRYSYAAVAALSANGKVSADSIAVAANNGSYAHDVVTGLVDAGVIAVTEGGKYIRGEKSMSNANILKNAFAKVAAEGDVSGKVSLSAENPMDILSNYNIHESMFNKPKMLAEAEGSTTLPLAAEYYALSLAYTDKTNKAALKESSGILRDMAKAFKTSSFVVTNDIDSLDKWREKCDAELEAHAELAAQAGVKLSGDLELNFGFAAEQTISAMFDPNNKSIGLSKSKGMVTWTTINGSLNTRVDNGFVSRDRVSSISGSSFNTIGDNVSVTSADFQFNGEKLSQQLKAELFSEMVYPEQQEAYKQKAYSTVHNTMSQSCSMSTQCAQELDTKNMDTIKPMSDLYVDCYIYHDLNEESVKVDQKYNTICKAIIEQVRAGILEKDYAKQKMEEANNLLIEAKSIGITVLDSDCVTIQNDIRQKLNKTVSSEKEVEDFEDYVKEVLQDADRESKFSSDNVVDTYKEQTEQILHDLKSILR